MVDPIITTSLVSLIGTLGIHIGILGFFGVADEIGKDDWKTCLDLTEEFPADIPPCHTIGDCKVKVEENFSLKEKQEALAKIFSLRTLQKIDDYYTELAYVWLNFNQAKTALNQVREGCQKTNGQQIKDNTQLLSYHLEQAFLHADQGFILGQEVIKQVKEELEAEKVELLKDRQEGNQYYNDYLKLKNELNRDYNNYAGDSSFTSTYNKQREELSAFNDKFAVDEFAYNWQTDPLGFIASNLDDYFLDDPESQKKLDQSLNFWIIALKKIGFIYSSKSTNSLLEDFDVGKFFKILDNLAGDKQSAAQRLIFLLTDIVAHRKELENTCLNLNRGIYSELEQADEALDGIAFEAYEGFDQNFLAELQKSSGQTEPLKAEKYGIDNIPEFKKEKINELEELRNEYYALDRGIKLSEIPIGEEISRLIELKDRADYLKDKILYFKNEFTAELLALCDSKLPPMSPTATSANRLIQCQKYESLQEDANALLKPLTDLNSITPEIMELKKLFLETKELLEKLKTIHASTEKQRKAMASFELFFDNNRPLPEKILPQFEAIKMGLNELKIDLEESFRTALPAYLAETAKISFVPLETAYANRPVKTEIRIEINSPFTETINQPLRLSLNHQELGKKSLLVELDALAPGTTLIKREKTEFLASTKETLLPAIIRMDSGQAVLSKKIELTSSGEIPLLKVETTLINTGLKPSEIMVVSNEQAITALVDNSILTFGVEKPLAKQEFLVTYSVLEAVTFESDHEVEQVNETTFNYWINARVKNNLPLALEKFKVLLPDYLKESNVENIRCFDESGESLKVGRLSNSRFSVEMKGMQPNQTASLKIEATVKNFEQMYREKIDEAQEALDLMGASDNSTHRQETEALALKLEEKLEGLNLQDNKELTSLAELLDQINVLEDKEKSYRFYQLELNTVEEKARQLLQRQKDKAARLNEAGFEKESLDLKELIASAEIIIGNAESFKNQGEFDKAIKKFWEAVNALQEKGIEPNELLIENEAELIRQWQENKKRAQDYQLFDDTLLEIETEIVSLDANFMALMQDAELGLALKLLTPLAEKVNAFNTVLEEKSLSKAQEIVAKASELAELKNNVERQLEKIDGLFKESKNNPLKSTYLYPLTEEEFNDIESEFKVKEKSKTVRELKNFNEGKPTEEILEDYSKIALEFEQVFTWLKSKDNYLNSRLNQIKSDAGFHYNKAAGLLEAEPDDRAGDLVEQSRQALNKEDYLNAIKYADAATGLINLGELPQNFEIPLAVYPLFAMLAVLGVITYRKHKKNGEKQSFSFLDEDDNY